MTPGVYKTGLITGLFDYKHAEKMDMAIYLFGWLVSRQTGVAADGRGLVLYGNPVSYARIIRETGFPRRTLERWMNRLREGGYISTERRSRGMQILIFNQKKFSYAQGHFSTGNVQPDMPPLAHIDAPKVAHEYVTDGASESRKPYKNQHDAHASFKHSIGNKYIKTNTGASAPASLAEREGKPEPRSANHEPDAKLGREVLQSLAVIHGFGSKPMTDAEWEQRRQFLHRQAEELLARSAKPA
jgi:hypothetical protein